MGAGWPEALERGLGCLSVMSVCPPPLHCTLPPAPPKSGDRGRWVWLETQDKTDIIWSHTQAWGKGGQS